ncbi:MAG TPA: hypothetical protein VFM34_01440 [Moraxellaceae bacterium]|nr:hypothetical protein [Moraxellaceae bacterium]
MNSNVQFFNDLLAEANRRDGFTVRRQKPEEVRCLRCNNVWLTKLQPVCDACGCGSWQSVEKDHVA